MSWEDQGRQEHGWFGHGTAPPKFKDDDNDANSRFGPGGLDTRIRSLGHCAICATPRRLRFHSAAKFAGPSLDRLVETMRAWVRGLHLDPASFAKRFFNSTQTDPVVEQLRSAAQMAAFARTNADLRDGTAHLAAAMQRVGLDRWRQFFADAHERALAAAPPPLDPNRPFVIGERFERAMARVLHTPPRPGTPGAPAPVLPPGRYEPGLDNLARRIAGAEPGDLPQLYADITALYMQPGAHRAGEALIRAARDAANAGSDARARQEVLDDIAPIARQDPRQLAASEFGTPGMGLLGGSAGITTDVAEAADGAEAANSTLRVGDAGEATKIAGGVGQDVRAAAGEGTREDLINELVQGGVKVTSRDVIGITRMRDGRIVFLERGNSASGLQHIVERHGLEFAQAGIPEGKLPEFLISAVKNGKIVGVQGRNAGRSVYEVDFEGRKQSVAISLGSNGYIVGANMR